MNVCKKNLICSKRLKVPLRMVRVLLKKRKRVYEIKTNNFVLPASGLLIYKTIQEQGSKDLTKLLQSHLVIKNAIEIQIWVCLIVQLILLVIQVQAKQWAEFNMFLLFVNEILDNLSTQSHFKNPD